MLAKPCQLWYNFFQEMLTTLIQKGALSIQNKDLFGRYRIVSVLGQGNNSQVYLAEHRKLQVYRAIKRIPRAHLAQPQFLLEADILKNLKHPCIPIIYDVEEDEEAFYMIEEYIQGQSLEAFALHQECISMDTALSIVLQICDVLEYLHERKPFPVIHQDLKPEHIILCGERIVLVDFGIASYITGNGNAFQNYGTCGYAPPEKYRGIACDARTDIYGVGKILEFLAGKSSPQEARFLKPFIDKAAAFSMDGRYPSVGALKADLSACLDSGYQNNQQDQKKILKNKKHLRNQIAVAGTQKRVGVTHFSIALTCFFNQQKRPGIYQEQYGSDCLRMLVRENSGFYAKDGLIVYEKFRGMPYYGGEIAQQDAAGCLYIRDCGTQWQDILEEEEETLIIIAGSRPWEMEKTRELFEKAGFRRNTVFICNYSRHAQAKMLAKEYGRRVYCFPLDADPFYMTAEKRRFFHRLLQQEGW